MQSSIQLSKLRLDGPTQSRVKIDQATVDEYAERVKAGDEFPPIDLFHDGEHFWIGGGFHRAHAHAKAGKKTIACTINKGSQRDAVLFSCVANYSHGLPRTRADKRKAVETMLRDEEWSQFSDGRIAELCHVSQPFVSGIRRSLESRQLKTELSCAAPQKRIGRDGKTRKVAAPAPPQQAPDRPGVEPEREPGDDTEIIKAEQAKRRASGKEVISPKERKAAQQAFGVVTRFIDKLKRHDELRTHLAAIAAALEGGK